jgi:hypothetical protein
MRISLRAVTPAVVSVLLGCDSSTPRANVATVAAPHHGTMIPLPDDRGFVELINEPEVGDRRNPQPTSIVAYYLQADGKSPLNPAPANVNFGIDMGGGKGARGKQGSAQSVPLNAEPKADDPAGASRYASKPGPYDLTAIRGALSATIGGQEISVPFAGGR